MSWVALVRFFESTNIFNTPPSTYYLSSNTRTLLSNFLENKIKIEKYLSNIFDFLFLTMKKNTIKFVQFRFLKTSIRKTKNQKHKWLQTEAWDLNN